MQAALSTFSYTCVLFAIEIITFARFVQTLMQSEGQFVALIFIKYEGVIAAKYM